MSKCQAHHAHRALREILETLRSRTGRDFRHHESADVVARIERRMRVHGIVDLSGYRDFLEGNVGETPELLRELQASDVRPGPAVDELRAGSTGGADGTKSTHALVELHRRLLELRAPASIVVGENNDVLHLSEHACRFLRVVGGEPTHDVLALARPELKAALRASLLQARRSGQRAESRAVQLEESGRSMWVRISVHPCRDPEVAGEVALVVFEEAERSPDAAPYQGAPTDNLVAELGEELQRTRAQLRATIERADASLRELGDSRDELRVSVARLASTNVELEAQLAASATARLDLENLIAASDIATVFVDGELRIARATPRIADIFNLIPGDVGRSLLDITHRLQYDRLEHDLRDVFANPQALEREVPASDGRWYIARLNPCRARDGRVEAAVLTFFDITSRRRAEEQLRQGERQMRLVAESTRDHAIVTTDVAGLVTSWNGGAERIFGFREEEILGRSADAIFVPEDRAAGVPDDERRRARDEGRAEDERWHQRKDGTRLYVSGVMTPLVDSTLRGYVKIARDLTERTRRDHERDVQLRTERLVLAEARASNQLKDEFLAVMSHELKNPLNLVQINAELLSRLPEVRDSDIGARATDAMQRAVASQARIIDDLLDLSRAHTGKLRLELDHVDVRALVERIGAQLRQLATEHRVSVVLPDEPVSVRGDLTRIEQVTWNLLSNALKFTPAGGRVSLALAREDGFASITVRDEGRGVEAGFLGRMFQLFQQAERYTTRAQGGLGIGLALVRELVELHGGHVRAESAGPGHGTTIMVFLPTCAEDRVESRAASSRARLAGLRVLIVDDAPDTVEAFRTLLELEGAIVLTAHDAREALSLLDGRELDLLCSDIAMPGMDGYALLGEVRKRPEYERLPAIALTGFGRVADVEQATAAGFNAHLVKPFRLDQLLVTLADLDIRAGKRHGNPRDAAAQPTRT